MANPKTNSSYDFLQNPPLYESTTISQSPVTANRKLYYIRSVAVNIDYVLSRPGWNNYGSVNEKAQDISLIRNPKL